MPEVFGVLGSVAIKATLGILLFAVLCAAVQTLTLVAFRGYYRAKREHLTRLVEGAPHGNDKDSEEDLPGRR